MFVDRLSSAVQKNDWDAIYTISRSLTVWSLGLHVAAWNTNIAMIHLFNKGISESLKPTFATFIQQIIIDDKWQSIVILYRLGYDFDRRHQYQCIISTSNTRYLDWMMSLFEPDIPEPIYNVAQLQSVNRDMARAWLIPAEIIRHLIYRNWAIGFFDQETLTGMKNVLSTTHLDQLPDDLLYEICQYMFTCFPPTSVSL